MPPIVMSYVWAIIGAGAATLALSLYTEGIPIRSEFLVYAALAMLGSIPKLRLPGLAGTYSASYLFLLYGIAHQTLAETLLAGALAAVAGSLLNVRKRPQPIQIAFNAANLVLSGAICHTLWSGLHESGVVAFQPALLALVAALYFVLNTVLVSGVLSRISGRPLEEVCGEWYSWSLPYTLLGAIAVGLIPSGNQRIPVEAALLIAPVLYMVHFFIGLRNGRRDSADAEGDQMPAAARRFVSAMIAAGALTLLWALVDAGFQDPSRLAAWLALTLIASTRKLRLPGMTGTVSFGFVALLAPVVTGTLTETVVFATLSALTQSLWRAARRPRLQQLAFNTATVIVASAFAHFAVHALPAALSDNLVTPVVLATAILYLFTTLAVAAVLCLINRRPMSGLWERTYFWTAPYYLVGAAVGGLILSTAREAGWFAALLVVPVLWQIYVSYGMHVQTSQSQTPVATH